MKYACSNLHTHNNKPMQTQQKMQGQMQKKTANKKLPLQQQQHLQNMQLQRRMRPHNTNAQTYKNTQTIHKKKRTVT